MDRFRLILQPSIEGSLDPVTAALNDTVADLQQAVSALQSTIRNKDDEILALRREVAEMQSRNDDLEQHSRRASVRVFGVQENTPGSTDDKLLDLCNMGLKLQPPLALEEIEVSHRVGKVIEERVEPSDGQTMTKAKPRPIIVKFVSRRTKARVMAARKILRPKETRTRIYINDLYNICQESVPILFADDINLFYSASNLANLESRINSELSNISTWLKVNKLSLNIKKTHYIIFHRKKEPFSIEIKINNKKIEQVYKTKFLGVVIDPKLSWKNHITLVSGKLSRSIGMIINARQCLNRKALTTLHYSFFYPYLTYCNHVWGRNYEIP